MFEGVKMLVDAATHPRTTARLARVWGFFGEIKDVLKPDLEEIEKAIDEKYGEDVDEETARKAGEEFMKQVVKLLKAAAVKEKDGKKALVMLVGERRKVKVTVIYEVVDGE